MSKEIAVVGCGGWGTALSIVLAHNGYGVRMWSHSEIEVKNVNEFRENKRFLKGVKLPESITVSTDFKYVLEGMDFIVLANPSQFQREVLLKAKDYIDPSAIIVNVAKGIENNTLLRMSQMIKEAIPECNNIATLSGPSHAEEVGRRIPTVVVVASENRGILPIIQSTFMNEYFRVYTNEDIVGVELGGSLKNIIALAAGICDGLGFGDNTKGALLTRGLAEMTRLGMKLGAKKETFSGISGMGDLITTCMSKHSRNRFVGEQIGRGKKLKEIIEEMVMVVEGVKTTKSAYELGKKAGVELPITVEVYKVLFEDKSPLVAVKDLMLREAKSEFYWL